jgi:hypothetical protein
MAAPHLRQPGLQGRWRQLAAVAEHTNASRITYRRFRHNRWS